MSSSAGRLIGITSVLALLAGGAIAILAFLVARYGPSGGDWSFKGNGALAVYPVFAPLMTAGWTALVLHARRHRRWLELGIAAGSVGLVIAVLAALMLPLFGVAADQSLTPILYILLLLWMLAAPAWPSRRRDREVAIVGYGRHVAAGAAWLVAALIGLFVIGIIVPAGS
jgi:hypothetical protein